MKKKFPWCSWYPFDGWAPHKVAVKTMLLATCGWLRLDIILLKMRRKQIINQIDRHHDALADVKNKLSAQPAVAGAVMLQLNGHVITNNTHDTLVFSSVEVERVVFIPGKIMNIITNPKTEPKPIQTIPEV